MAPSGQPPPGRTRSSSGNPVGMTARATVAALPRHTRAFQSFHSTSLPKCHWRSFHRVANDADDYALDGQCLLAKIDLDRRELGILGHQPHAMAFLSIAFDGDFVLQTRD